MACLAYSLDSRDPIGHPARSLECSGFGFSPIPAGISGSQISDNKTTLAVGEPKATQDRYPSSRYRHNGGKLHETSRFLEGNWRRPCRKRCGCACDRSIEP
jgi:hypothetical protein